MTRAHQQTALNGCHQDAGHQGKKWTLSLVRDKFWWPCAQEAMENAVCDCKCCQTYGGSESRAPMISLKETAPPSTSASGFHISHEGIRH